MSFGDTITGAVLGQPSAPEDTNNAANAIAEGAAVNTSVGITAQSTFFGLGPVFYSLSGDTSSGGFKIDPFTGVVTVADPSKIDFESSPGHAYTLTVRSTFGIFSNTQTFTIGVNDVAPSTPVDANAAANIVAEGAANGTAVGITASSTDVNGPAVTWSLTGDTSGGGFTINATTGVITVADGTKIDYESSPGHAYTVTATASDGTLTSSQTFTINVSDVPLTTPVDADTASNSVAEGAAAGTTVGVTASATDPNGPATTYSLIGDTSGGGFTINASTGVVTVANPAKLDFESSAPGHTYNITVQASNGVQTTSQVFTVGVTDVAPSAPTDGDPAANGVTEGAANGTAVGITASSTDLNGGAITYSLIADNSSGFAINPTTGVVTIADTTKIDYETAPGHVYTITVRASDGTLSNSQSFTIAMTDVAPSVPTDIDGATNTVAEGAANGSTVGITASSADINGPVASVTYSLVGDTSNGGFTINSTTGVITVADGTKLDYETTPSHAYTVTAQASDGTLTNSHTFNIALTDVAPSAPTDINGAPNTVAEGAANGSTVGITASSVDPNGPATTYSLSDSAGGRFAIDSSTGIVTVANGAAIDFETAAGHAYGITVLATSGALSTSSAFAIGVTNVAPSTPIDTNNAADSVAEGAANGTAVGITVSSSDPGGGPALTYSLTDNAGGRFAIDPNSGIVIVANSAAIDFETATGHAYSITVQASDGALTNSKTFSIGVTDVAPGTPTDGDNAINTVAEGATTGAVVGFTASSTDVNGPAVSYSFADIGGGVMGDAGGRFQINSSTGVVSVSAFGAANIDYESAAGHSYSVTVQASDGTLTSAPQTFAIAVTNVAPSAPNDGDSVNANTVTEGAPSGTYTGLTAASTDPNSAASTVTYSLTDDAGGRFAINSSTGAVSTGANANLIDFESAAGHAYSVTVRATDSSGAVNDHTDQTFTIAVANANPSTPADGNTGTANSILEGLATGASTGLTVQATDPGGTAVTYTLTDDAGGRFQILDPSTGVVTAGPNANLIDFESSGGSYNITAQASDGAGGTSTHTFAIAVDDAAPANWSDQNAGAETVVEGAANGTAVGVTAHAIDPNGGTVHYSIVGGNPSGAFTIDPTSGVITVADGTKIDFESTAGSVPAHTYKLTVQGADDNGLSTTNDFVINVTNAGPSTPTGSNGTIAEGALQGATVGITALSVDPGDAVGASAVTYSLSNSAGGLFTIDPTSGVVSVTAAGATGIDYENTVAAGHAYTISVDATDGTTTSSQNFSIAVTNVAPSQPTDSDGATGGTVQFSAANGTAVGITLASTDPNGGTITYSLAPGGATPAPVGAFTVDPGTGIVTVADHTLLVPATSYTVIGSASDGTTSSANQTFSIFVTNPNINVDLDSSDNTATGNNYAATFTEQAPTGVSITDTDDVISNTGNPGVTTATSATIVLTNAQAGDSLLVNGVLPGGISQSTTTGAGTITITLSGSASYTAYQTALHQIQFSTAGDAPNVTPRVIDVTVTDSTGTSPAAVSTISVVATNDPAVLSLGPAAPVSYVENAAATAFFTTGSVTDPDAPANFNGGSYTVAITNPDPGGGDQIVLLGSSGFSASGSSILLGGTTIGTVHAGTGLGTSTVTIDLNTSATPAIVNQLSDAFGFQSSSENPSTTDRTVHFTFNDGGNTGGGALNSNIVTQTVHVTAVNDAPVVTATTLASVPEDTANPSGATVSSLFAGHFTDADNGAATIFGIAVSGNTANAVTEGTWQYSTDGTNWFDVGSVSGSSALALSAASELRFKPAPDFNGTPTALQIHGLDDTFGGTFTSGATTHFTDATVNGGATAVSANEVAVATTITEVNDAPVAGDDSLSAIAEDSGARVIPFATLIGNDTPGALNESGQTLTVINPTNAVGGTVQIVGTDVIFTPTANFNGTASFDYTVRDNGTTNGAADPLNSATPGHVTFNVTAVNDAPVNTVPFATQQINENASNVPITGISISDVDDNGGNESTELTTLHGGNLHVIAAGAAVITGDNSQDLKITGTVTDINATLVGLKYMPANNYLGPDTITVTTDDGGNTGADPGLTGTATSEADTDTVAIQVVAPITTGPSSQLWYVTRDGDATVQPGNTFSDNVVGYLNSNNTSITPTQDTGATSQNENDIALYSARGLYFVATNDLKVESHHTSDGTLAGATPTLDLSTFTTVDSVADDPFLNPDGNNSHGTLFVGVTGATAATTGILEAGFTGAGDLSNPTPQYLITQDSFAGFHQAIDYAIDLNSQALYYVDDDGANSNQIFEIDYANGSGGVKTDVTTPTAVSDLVQFPANGTAGFIEAVAVNGNTDVDNPGDDIVYFLTSDHKLWYIDRGSATPNTATQVTGVTLTGVGAHAGLAYDSVSHTLFITDQGSNSIIQAHLSAVDTVDTVTNTYTTDQLTGHAVSGAPIPGPIALDTIPLLTVHNGAFTEINPTSTPTALDAAATIVDPDLVATGATITLTGGFAGSGDVLAANTSGTSITVASNTTDANGNITLVLSGVDSTADYQQVLQSITFNNTGDNPTNFGNNTSRSITWHVNDGAQGDPLSDSNTKTSTLTVTNTDDAPVAQADSATGNQDQSIAGQAVATDVDNTPAQLTYSLVGANGGALHGAVTISTSGAYIYTPDAGFKGDDSFTFKANDGIPVTGDSNDALISIHVNAVNQAPVAQNGTASGDEDTAITGSAVATDVDSPSLTYGLVGAQGGAQHGTVTFTDASTGAFTYTPNQDFFGTDTFTFSASDGFLSSNNATITLTVNPVNDAPVLDLNSADGPASKNFAASYTISGTPAAIAPATVSITDVDDGNVASATVTLTNAQTNDVLAINGALPGGISAVTDTSVLGVIKVTLSGSATLAQYQTALHQIVFSNGSATPDNTATDRVVNVVVDDGHVDNHASNTATTTIHLTQDTAPVANAKTASATEAGGANNGTAGSNGSGNVITDATADSDAEDATAALVVSAVNSSGASVGHALTGTYGSLTLNADGSYTYIVDDSNATVQGLRTSGQTLSDPFTYTIRDTAGLTSTNSLTVTIHGANDNPVAVIDTPSATEAGTSAGIDPGGNVLTNDTDVDSVANGETKTVVGVATGTVAGPISSVINAVTGIDVVSASGFGTLNVHTDGTYTYTVNNANATVQALRTSAQTLTDTFSYTMQDTATVKSTTQVTVTIHGQNDAPVANNDAANAQEQGGTNNGSGGFNPSGNVLTAVGGSHSTAVADTDPDTAANGETQTVQGVVAGDHHLDPAQTTGVGSAISGTYGSLTINSNGSFSYALNNSATNVQALTASDHPTDTFTYTMHDTAGVTSNATVTVTVDGANDAPVAADDGTYVVSENRTTSPVTAPGLLANDTDVDAGTTLTAVKNTDTVHGGTVTVNANGTFSVAYAAGSNYLGADSFTYHAADNGSPSLSSGAATVTLDVQPLVWHIDNTAAAGGDGSAAHPFNSIAAFNTANAAAGTHPDLVYLHFGSGTYSEADGVNLNTGQSLIGQGSALTYQTSASSPGGVQTVTLIAADPAHTPTIQVTGATGQGVTLAQNNTLQGFHIDTSTNAGAIGIEDSNAAGAAGAVGTLNVSNVDITGAGKAIDIDQGGTLNVSLNSVTSTGSNSEGIQLGGIAGTNTIGGSFAVTGTTSITNADTTGIQVSNTAAGASFNFGTSTTVNDTAIGTGHNGNGIDFTTGIGATNSFSLGNTSITTDGGFGLAASGGTINIGGTASTINANGGAAVDLTNSSLGSGATFATVSSTNSTGTGIQITGLSTGNFTANGGTISNATGTDVSITGGTSNITYNGSISDDVGQLVSVASKTGGTVAFGGSITDLNNGTGNGISLTNNTGATINFTGGTTLSTGANNAFTATGGGTVNVTGTNHLTTTTGTALNITNTNIGASNVIFQDISSNGGSANGIILNNTGTAAGNGGLHVTGNGATVGASGGGVIANKTGADGSTTQGTGILLNGTKDVQLNGMQLNDLQNFAINGNNVTGFTLDHSVINGDNGTSNSVNDPLAAFANVGEDAVRLTNLLGSGSITNSNISGGYTNTVMVENNTGTLNRLTIDHSTIGGRTDNGTGMNDGVNFQADAGSTAMNITVSNSTLTTARGGVFVATTQLGTTSDVKFQNNTVTNNHPAIVAGGGLGVDIAGLGNTTFDVSGNSFDMHAAQGGTGIKTHVIEINKASGSGSSTFDGTVANNTVGVAGVAHSGSGIGSNDIDVNSQSNGTFTISILNNNLQEYDQSGIQISQISGNSTVNATIQGNTTVPGPGANPFAGLFVVAGALASDAGTTNILVGGSGTARNDLSAGDPTNSDDVFFEKGSGATLNLSKGVSGAATASQVIKDNNLNPATTTVGTSGTITLVNTNPPLPLLAAPGGVEASSPTPGETNLTQAELDSVVAAAIGQWASAGASAAQLAALHSVTFSVADLAGNIIGDQGPGAHITIDTDAAGHGWFVDPTPNDNSEFTHAQNAAGTDLLTDPSNAAAGHIDLLTTVTHELGHVLGLDDVQAPADDLMYVNLVDGERRLPDAADVAQANDTTVAQAVEAAMPLSAQAAGGTPIIVGTPANDTIDAGHGGNILFGGAGADTFVFGPSTPLNAPTPAQVTHVADYSAAQGDTFDFSAITSAFHNSGVSDTLVVRAVEDASGKFATLQVDHIDPMGLPSAPIWVNVAQLDGAHSGDAVNVLIDSHSAVHLAQIHVDLLV